MREKIKDTYKLLKKAGAEERKSQEEMSVLVFDNLDVKGHSCIEAPTGTGKSMGYLIGAILWALKNKETIAVSTATKTLQEQLMADFDKLCPVIEKVTGKTPKIAMLKGRNNYISKLRYRDYVLDVVGKELDDPEVGELTMWTKDTKTGDMSEIEIPEILSESSICVPDQGTVDEDCFYQRALVRARKADIIITNHHAVLGRMKGSLTEAKDRISVFEDLNVRNIIFDEAHELERIALNIFIKKVSFHEIKSSIATLINFVHKKRKKLGFKSKKEAEFTKTLKDQAEEISKAMKKLKDIGEGRSLLFVGKNGDSNNGESGKVDYSVIASSLRSAQKCLDHTREVADKLIGISVEKNLRARVVKDVQEIINSYAKEIPAISKEYTSSGNLLYVEFSDIRRYPSIIQANNNIRGILSNKWKMFDSLLYTSATISIPSKKSEDTWAYFREGIGLSINKFFRPPRFVYTVLPSPFKYEGVTLYLPPKGGPRPSEDKERGEYLKYIKKVVNKAIKKDKDGGIMVLCTSYRDIRDIHKTITNGDVKLNGRKVIIQDRNTRFKETRDQFTKDPRRHLLLATGSFWTGVDFPREQLTTLIISRIPFDVVNDPANRIRRMRYKRENDKYVFATLPAAIIKFRQGIGRLIRTKEDYGNIFIADSRVRGGQFELVLKFLKNKKEFTGNKKIYILVDSEED